MPVINGDGRRQKQDSPPTNQLHTHSPIRKPQRNKLYQPNIRMDTQSKGPLIANGALSSISTRPKYMCIIYIIYKSAALWARLFIINSWHTHTQSSPATTLSYLQTKHPSDACKRAAKACSGLVHWYAHSNTYLD